MSRFVKAQPKSIGDSDLSVVDVPVEADAGAAEPPEWFARAVASAPEPIDVDRGGRTVRAYSWGPPTETTVVLVHGMGANAHWWDHIGPLLQQPGRRIVSLDLSGHGQSGNCDNYMMGEWAEDVVAVCDALAIEHPLLVGHSAGGRVAFTVAIRHPKRVAGLVVIDSAIVPGTLRAAPISRGRTPQTELRVYPDREDVLARFRTLPPQRVVLPYIRRHIAERSIEAVPGGWQWLHDPALYNRSPSPDETPERLECPLYYLRCEHGTIDREMETYLRDRFEVDLTYFELPDSGHHAMLDHPLALVAMLRVILFDLTRGRELLDV